MNSKLINFLTELEKRVRFVYLDSGGAPTIGIGHLLTKDERKSGKIVCGSECVKYKNGITADQCNNLLMRDLDKLIKKLDSIILASLSEFQRIALISFAFNIGITAFEESTLLRKLNDLQFDEIPDQLRRWKYDNGKIVNGLIKRREKEVEMWMGR